MATTAQVAQASPLAAIFECYHVGWETRDPDMIASLHSEDTVFWLHDGSDPVTGRNALRQHCVELFAAFDFSHVMGRVLYGEDHWTLEWTIVLSLAERDGRRVIDAVLADHRR